MSGLPTAVTTGSASSSASDASSDCKRVVIMGGGMAGLASALALKASGREVVVIERDDEPEVLDPSAAFESWKRPGVPQLHHTHIFLARLQTILRDRHPELLAELAEVGIVPCTLAEILPPSLVDTFVPIPEDQDLLHLWGRRATFEYVLRRHVGRLANTRFVHGATVEGLVIEEAGGALQVRGVEITRGGVREVIPADIVVDATGARSKAPDWLRARGALIESEVNPSRCAYYCRHFQRRDVTERSLGAGTGASLDYLVFGTFLAEKDTFSIAFACPETETELSEFIRKPEGFDHVCRQIPVLERLTGSADPVSRVLGGAKLVNRWHHSARRGPPIVGFFPVGDSHIQTNPIYGRGCSLAFVQAEVLGEVVAGESDVRQRARRFHARVRELLKPHFDFCVAADRAMVARANLARGKPLSALERLLSFGYEKIMMPAIAQDPRIAREWLKAQEMREVSPPWVAIGLLFRILFRLALRGFKSPPGSVLALGPRRAELLQTFPVAQPSVSLPGRLHPENST